MKQQLESAYKIIETVKEKEEKNKQTITELKSEIQNLGKIIEEGTGLNLGQDNTINELIRAQEELTRERDQLNDDVVRLQQERNDNEKHKNKLIQNKKDTEEEIFRLRMII